MLAPGQVLSRAIIETECNALPIANLTSRSDSKHKASREFSAFNIYNLSFSRRLVFKFICSRSSTVLRIRWKFTCSRSSTVQRIRWKKIACDPQLRVTTTSQVSLRRCAWDGCRRMQSSQKNKNIYKQLFRSSCHFSFQLSAQKILNFYREPIQRY